MSQSRSPANPNTIQDKFLVGYQGWFTCAGDGEPISLGHHGWLHWFDKPMPTGGRPNIDLWPDTSAYDTSELFLAPGLTTATGDPVHLFSSRHPKTVRRHFHWMALHGVDGAFLQRFASQCEVKPGLRIRDLRDEVGDRVREAAEAEGRVFAIMYDVSGIAPDKIQAILEQDWVHLLSDKRLLDSPNYLRENGRPVVALWGFGFNGRNHTPDLVRAISYFFRSNTPGGVYLVAGTPGHWRTSNSDADRNPAFLPVWTECFDAISPWTVGRYGNEEEADKWGEQRVKADAEYLKSLQQQGGRKVDYMPVVLPGGSGFNLSGGKWGMNDIRRNGGRFLWRQIYNARRAGVRIMYGAMWDEYDEGTAFMPVVSCSSQLPVHPSFRFVALDVDGYELPSDWYMRIAGFAAEALHGERTLQDAFPLAELQDYWNTRPRLASKDEKRAEKQRDDVDEVARTFEAWQLSTTANVPMDAPPPYSLEEASTQQTAIPGRSARSPPPPVRQVTRPSTSHHSPSSSTVAGAAAASLAAAQMLASGSTSALRHGHGQPSFPPRVDTMTRPSPSLSMSTPTRSYLPPTEVVMAPPPVPQRPYGHGHSPEPGAGVYYPVYHRHHSAAGHVPLIGHGHGPIPAGMPLPGAIPVEHEHVRGRSRSRSRHRSRSRSSSGARKQKKKHGRSRSNSRHRRPSSSAHAVHPAHSASVGNRPVSHGHSLSPVGSSSHGTGLSFPNPQPGLHHARSDGAAYAHRRGEHGHGYEPVHSMPVGHPVGSSYAPYGASPQSAHPAYGGYGQQGGWVQGYDGVGGGGSQAYAGYGHTSPPGPYYASYVPGMGTPYNGPVATGGSGGGGIQGGVQSALQLVEGIAGKQRRQQLEKRVNKLTGNVLNKLK